MSSNRQHRSSALVRFFKGLYLDNRFFIALALLVLGLIMCFLFQTLLIVMQVLIGVFVVLLVIEAISLYRTDEGMVAYRTCPDRLSNGDVTQVSIDLKNNYPFAVRVTVVEEVPFQFQKRDLIFDTSLKVDEEQTLHYDIRPTQRGEYKFGNVNIFVAGVFSLMRRRYIIPQEKDVAVYPSFVEMHKYELLSISNRLTDYGIKRIRRIGHATEFEHIQQYVLGDDPRTINYKATARMNQLMVNTYNEERSQPVYCVVDKGRTMQMPFDGMTLLDYAINSALMVSNTALLKGDKAGLITFSNEMDDILPANSRAKQKQAIMNALYMQKTDFKESDFAKLYSTIRRKITQRSMIMLYTNFETLNGLQRQLKYLRLIAKDHLVIVAFFINSELNEVLESKVTDIEDIFEKGIAEQMSSDKYLIVKELNRNGIYTILSAPEDLSIDSMNKYLEMKSRGLI